MPRVLPATSTAAAGGGAGAGGPPDSSSRLQQQLTRGAQANSNSQLLQGYCFPGPSSAPPLRHVAVPTGFSSVAQYVGVLTGALTEEVNLQLDEQARTFYSIVKQLQQQPAGPSGGGGQPYMNNRQQQQHQQKQQYQQHKQQHGYKQSGGGGGGGGDVSARLQAACGRAGLRYHPGATLKVYNNDSSSNNSSKAGWGSNKGGKKRGRCGSKGADDADDDGDAGEDKAPVKAVSMYLTLNGKLDRRQFRCVCVLHGCVCMLRHWWGHVSAHVAALCVSADLAFAAHELCCAMLCCVLQLCRKHDLWVLSNNPLLKASAASSNSSGPYDRANQPWAVLARYDTV